MYFIQNKGACGPCCGQILEFFPGDTKELFEKNRKNLDKSWYWHNGPKITYKINNDGFRMDKDFDEIVKENYFLSIGCSFAFGIGMPYEELYTNLLAKDLNMNSVLLANPGMGMDAFFHNFFVWIEKYKKTPPKFVILVHTSLDRKTFYLEHNSYVSQTTMHPRLERNKSFKEYITHEYDELIDYKLKNLSIKNYCHAAKIKLIEFSSFEDCVEKLQLDHVDFYKAEDNVPFARDFSKLGVHPGYGYQTRVFNYLKKQLTFTD